MTTTLKLLTSLCLLGSGFVFATPTPTTSKAAQQQGQSSAKAVTPGDSSLVVSATNDLFYLPLKDALESLSANADITAVKNVIHQARTAASSKGGVFKKQIASASPEKHFREYDIRFSEDLVVIISSLKDQLNSLLAQEPNRDTIVNMASDLVHASFYSSVARGNPQAEQIYMLFLLTAARNQDLSKSLDSNKDAFAELQEKLSLSKDELTEVKKELDEKTSDYAELQSKFSSCEKNLTELKQKLDEKTSSCAEFQEKLSTSEKKFSELEQKFTQTENSMQEKLQESQASENQLHQNIQSLEQQLETQRQETRSIQDDYDRQRVELEQTQTQSSNTYPILLRLKSFLDGLDPHLQNCLSLYKDLDSKLIITHGSIEGYLSDLYYILSHIGLLKDEFVSRKLTIPANNESSINAVTAR